MRCVDDGQIGYVGGSGQQRDKKGRSRLPPTVKQPTMRSISTAYNEGFMSHAVTMDSVATAASVGRRRLNWAASILIAVLFLASGVWKISDPFGWAVLLHQLKFPQALSLPGAVVVGTLETFTGLMFLGAGLYRRIAAWMGSALLIVSS